MVICGAHGDGRSFVPVRRRCADESEMVLPLLRVRESSLILGGRQTTGCPTASTPTWRRQARSKSDWTSP